MKIQVIFINVIHNYNIILYNVISFGFIIDTLRTFILNFIIYCIIINKLCEDNITI